MIIFHEGLPRSGKSYEAMASRIVPAIKAGRSVIAYVEGINHAQIAQLCAITEERCRELLRSLTREELQTVHTDANTGKVVKVEDHLPQLARDNAVIVLDEAQNFWGNRARLGAEMTQFIAEHGHRGIDIFLMGQDVRDVHAVWRRRVELKLSFLKLNGFGKMFAKRYSCTTYRHLGGDEFKRVGVKINAYDPAYFGTYKSFTGDDINTEAYTDERAQVLSAPWIKYGLPVAIAAGIWGAWSSWRYFHPDPTPALAAKAPEVHGDRLASTTRPPPVVGPAVAPSAPVAASSPASQSPIERRMVALGATARIRLAGLISSKDHISGIVEWVQGGTVVVERISLDALRSLGVGVVVTDGAVVQLVVGDYRELATPWPLEDMARVSDARTQVIRGPQGLSSAAPMPGDVLAAAAPPTFVDRPGELVRDDSAGSLPRRIARVAR